MISETITVVVLALLMQGVEQLPSARVQVRTDKPEHGVQVQRRNRDANADNTALKQLETLRSLISESNYKVFGLATASDSKDLRLGDPLPVYYVSGKDLAQYKPGSDAGKIMKKTQRLLYPVLLADKGVTVITLEKIDDKWVLLEFGGNIIAPALAEAGRASKPPQGTRPGNGNGSYFAVQIPSLKRLTFIAYSPPPGPGGNEDQKRNVVLTPTVPSSQLEQMVGASAVHILSTHPNFSLEKKGSASANDVFQSLAPQAARVSESNVPQ